MASINQMFHRNWTGTSNSKIKIQNLRCREHSWEEFIPKQGLVRYSTPSITELLSISQGDMASFEGNYDLFN